MGGSVKKAELGMGTLIIFIAMILVSAVAAGVLIRTTGALQNKALQTGKATTAEVGSSLQTVSLYAEDGSDQDLEYLYHNVKLTSGSGAMKLDDVLLIMSTDNLSADYSYNSSIDCDTQANFSSTSYGYGVSYSIQGSNYKSGYMNRGDIVKFCYRAARDLIEDDEIRISFIPKTGMPHSLISYVPDMLINTREYIYP